MPPVRDRKHIDLQRLEIPFTGRWQAFDDPLLIDNDGYSDIKNMRYTDKSIRGVNGYSKINTAPCYASYNYTDFTETDVGGGRVAVAAHVITVSDLDTDEDVYVYKDEGAAAFNGDFEHQFDFSCDDGSTGRCGLWALTNNVDGLFGLANGDLDHLALRCDRTEGNDSYTKLLLHCNGSDGSTTIPDSSSSAHGNASVGGSAQLDTAQKKFDTASLLLGSGDYISFPDSNDWSMGTGNCNISFWIRLAADASLTESYGLWEQRHSGLNSSFGMALDYAEISGMLLSFYIYDDGDQWLYVTKDVTGLLALETWHRIDVIRGWGGNANDWVVCFDGAPGATETDALSWSNIPANFVIGKYGSNYFKGHIDEFEVAKGIARHTADFSGSLPSVAYGMISLILQETNGAVDTTDTAIDLEKDSVYYVTIIRDEAVGANGTLYAYIYSDSARATLFDMLTVTLTEKQDFQYIFGMISYDSATGGNAWSGTISNLAGQVYDNILAGFHFKKDQPDETHVLIQAEDDAGNTVVFENKTAIPNQGNFEDGAIHTDATGATVGRFCNAPQGNVVYCNSVESIIWAGDEGRCAAFILDTAAVVSSFTAPRDFTNQIQNSLTDTDEVAAIGGAYTDWVVGATRPLKGVKYYVSTANTDDAVMTAKEWTGTAWSALAITDNTAVTGKSLAQTGTVTWADTKTTSKTKYLGGRSLYWYLFNISAGSASISQVTVDASFQAIKNIWSGDPSVLAACKIYDGADYQDYTIEANDPITSTVVPLDSLQVASHLLLGFLTPQQGFEFFMVPGKANGDATVLTAYYWDGDSWNAVTGQFDGTSNGTDSMAKSGVICFTATTRGTEFPQIVGGQGPYYYYKLTWADPLDAETEVYYITGIEAPAKVPAYKFAVDFQTRVLLCNSDDSPEAVLISAENAPDVYNGDDSTTLYFGGHDDLVAGIGLYNRFGASIYNFAILCKKTETWILNGYSLDTFEKFTLSTNIGCCAPFTMDSCEVGYKITKEMIRNIAIWLSYDGPVLCDGGILMPIGKDIEPYFDIQDSRCVNYDAIDVSFGFFDPLLKEYNLFIPSGSQQTTTNTWLVYDLMRSKWFKKEPPEYPQCGFRVEDVNGAQYCYIGFASGYIRYNENGTTFDGTAIDQSVTLGDKFLTKSMWDITQAEFLKLICAARNTGDEKLITVKHRMDGSTTWDTLESVPMYEAGKRYVSHVQRLSQEPSKRGSSYEFELECSTDDKTDGMELIALGLLYRVIKLDTQLSE